jgi:hypothetical protein
MFGARFSRHLARRYRNRGLDKTAARMVSFIDEHGVEGATGLEIGGAIGEIQIELLRRDAAHATNLELADADADAMTAAAEHGRLHVTHRHLGLAWRVVGLAAPPG